MDRHCDRSHALELGKGRIDGRLPVQHVARLVGIFGFRVAFGTQVPGQVCFGHSRRTAILAGLIAWFAVQYRRERRDAGGLDDAFKDRWLRRCGYCTVPRLTHLRTA